jgi:hypothetical protein
MIGVPPIKKAHPCRAGDRPEQTLRETNSNRLKRQSREKPPKSKGWGYFFANGEGGGVEQDRTRTQTIPEISGWRTRPNFLADFLGKNFGNKNRVVSILEERMLRVVPF